MCIRDRYKTYNALAAGDPTKVSDTEYEVALRDGAKFSDGTDVTVADVVNALEVNMADATCGAFLSFIDSVAEKDDKTVTIKLKYPFALLKDRLTVAKVFPASLTEDQLKTMPIGSGPVSYTHRDVYKRQTLITDDSKSFWLRVTMASALISRADSNISESSGSFHAAASMRSTSRSLTACTFTNVRRPRSCSSTRGRSLRLPASERM